MRVARLLGLLLVVCLLGAASARASVAPVDWYPSPRLVERSAPYASPTELRAVACVSSTHCLAVGADGTVVSEDGSAPTIERGVDDGAPLGDVSCPSSGLCVVSEDTALLVSTDPTASRPAFRRVTPSLPRDARVDTEYAGVSCASARLCLAWTVAGAVEVSSDPAGGAAAWHTVTLAPNASGRSIFSAACAPGTTSCTVALGTGADSGTEFAVSSDPTAGASAWRTTAAPGLAAPGTLTCPTASLCAGTAGGAIETSDDPFAAGGPTWTGGEVYSTPHAALEGLACGPGGTEGIVCTAATSDGRIATSADPTAGADAYAVSAVLDPAGFGTANVAPFACPTRASCVIPDRTTGLATVTLGAAPRAHIDSGLGGFTAISGLACPSSTLCVGVDPAGGVQRSTHATKPATAWRRTIEPGASAGLTAVACPSTRLCVAVGNEDRVLTSVRPAGGAKWREATLPFTYTGGDGSTSRYDLTSISCPTTTFCLAGDSEYGLIDSTRPAGGAGAWSFEQLGSFDADAWDAVSCASAHLCVAGDARFGRVAVNTVPTAGGAAWHFATIAPGGASRAPGISAVSCPVTSFCLAGDRAGAIYTTMSPDGGARAWHRTKIASSPLIAADCRSAGFCVVIDDRRQAFASTDPAGGARAWRSVTLPVARFAVGGSAAQQLDALACAPTHFCLAANGAGALFPGNTP